MQRPSHLTQGNAKRFTDQSVVDVYHLRLPYPPATFEILADLIAGGSKQALDVGTGTGELACGLAPLVDHVDAVDISATMLEKAHRQPDAPANIDWHLSPIEEFTSDHHYHLIMGGDSIHWMDWDVVLPKFRRMLVPGGFLALVTREELPTPWQSGLYDLIRQYSTIQDYEAYDLKEELVKRNLFQVVGQQQTSVIDYEQSINNYIESFHSRASFSREMMATTDADEFDRDLRILLEAHRQTETIKLQTVARVIWGYPLDLPLSK